MNWERLGELDACFSPFSLAIKKEVKREQKNHCVLCGKRSNLQIHHEIPMVFNGKNDLNNAFGLCPRCHKVADYNVIEHGMTLRGQFLNELPGTRFKGDYNPFKDMEIRKIPAEWRHDLMMIKVGKHTREWYEAHQTKKKKHRQKKKH